jgi:lipopolysaccharide transport system ATP-binding protein
MTEAISFKQVSKRYYLGTGREGLRGLISQSAARFMPARKANQDSQLIWALREVSFGVETGEVLGIIGANGAGKTTALKLLSRVTCPTLGGIVTKGRIASLIELGAGFHPDLTGRDNIYLNGAIMGLSQREISRRFDSIVAFAELEEFIDTPVKRYSSGMYARLGFAVAAHVEPDILLIDEVLAVGDEAFQMKCHDFIHSFAKSGRTSVFVSHNLYAIDQLCDRAIWLDHGQIMRMGGASQVLQAFMDEVDQRLTGDQQHDKTLAGDRIKIRGLRITDRAGVARERFNSGEDVVVAIDYQADGEGGRPFFCVWVSEGQSRVPLFAANMLLDDFAVPNGNGAKSLVCHFKSVPLMPRAYTIWVEVYGSDRSKLLYKWRALGGFHVLDDEVGSAAHDVLPGSVRFRRAHGPIQVAYEWSV